MPSRYTYTDNQLRDAVAASTSYRQVFQILELKASGKGYQGVRERIRALGIPTAHMIGRSPHTPGRTRSLDEVLVYGSGMRSHEIRRRLISEGVWQHQCHGCSHTHWRGCPIPLELHHKDGDPKNNALENLELLCPNCHAQTDNHAGRGSQRAGRTKVQTPQRTCLCGRRISARATQCKSCVATARTTVAWPPLDEFAAMLTTMSYKAIGRDLGASDTAVRNRAQRLGLIPTPG